MSTLETYSTKTIHRRYAPACGGRSPSNLTHHVVWFNISMAQASGPRSVSNKSIVAIFN